MKFEKSESVDSSFDLRQTKETFKIVDDLDTAGLLARQLNRYQQLTLATNLSDQIALINNKNQVQKTSFVSQIDKYQRKIARIHQSNDSQLIMSREQDSRFDTFSKSSLKFSIQNLLQNSRNQSYLENEKNQIQDNDYSKLSKMRQSNQGLTGSQFDSGKIERVILPTLKNYQTRNSNSVGRCHQFLNIRENISENQNTQQIFQQQFLQKINQNKKYRKDIQQKNFQNERIVSFDYQEIIPTELTQTQTKDKKQILLQKEVEFLEQKYKQDLEKLEEARKHPEQFLRLPAFESHAIVIPQVNEMSQPEETRSYQTMEDRMKKYSQKLINLETPVQNSMHQFMIKMQVDQYIQEQHRLAALQQNTHSSRERQNNDSKESSKRFETQQNSESSLKKNSKRQDSNYLKINESLVPSMMQSQNSLTASVLQNKKHHHHDKRSHKEKGSSQHNHSKQRNKEENFQSDTFYQKKLQLYLHDMIQGEQPPALHQPPNQLDEIKKLLSAVTKKRRKKILEMADVGIKMKGNPVNFNINKVSKNHLHKMKIRLNQQNEKDIDQKLYTTQKIFEVDKLSECTEPFSPKAFVTENLQFDAIKMLKNQKPTLKEKEDKAKLDHTQLLDYLSKFRKTMLSPDSFVKNSPKTTQSDFKLFKPISNHSTLYGELRIKNNSPFTATSLLNTSLTRNSPQILSKSQSYLITPNQTKPHTFRPQTPTKSSKSSSQKSQFLDDKIHQKTKILAPQPLSSPHVSIENSSSQNSLFSYNSTELKFQDDDDFEQLQALQQLGILKKVTNNRLTNRKDSTMSVTFKETEESQGEELIQITDYEMEKKMRLVVDVGAIKNNLGQQADEMVTQLTNKIKDINFKKKLVTDTSTVEQELKQSLRLGFYYNCQRLAVHFPPNFIQKFENLDESQLYLKNEPLGQGQVVAFCVSIDDMIPRYIQIQQIILIGNQLRDIELAKLLDVCLKHV